MEYVFRELSDLDCIKIQGVEGGVMNQPEKNRSVKKYKKGKEVIVDEATQSDEGMHSDAWKMELIMKKM